MRRLVPFLLAAIMASFPSSFFLLLIGPLIANSGGISCTSAGSSHCSNYGSGGALTGVAASSAATTYSTQSRTMSTTTAIMMASTLSSKSGRLPGASAESVQGFSDMLEPVGAVSNTETSIEESSPLGFDVLGVNAHCSFSMVEFTNIVS